MGDKSTKNQFTDNKYISNCSSFIFMKNIAIKYDSYNKSFLSLILYYTNIYFK